MAGSKTPKKSKKATTKPIKAAKRPIEQYEHRDKQRPNNPPVGLVTPDTDRDGERRRYAYDPHLDPQLQWAGKAEHTSFAVPTVSLHVHERVDPKTILSAVRRRNGEAGGPSQLSLFAQPKENPPLREALDFYRHAHGWTNRLIAGDSLLVMNSLLEKEGMAGKVQMIYIDPPYGIRYGSNFQPFVNRRDVKDGKDEDLTQEPEMIRAFRDTWELGINSYLSYLRDRLLLAHNLLHESGSCFVQIGDENVHLVRCLMDEVFGPDQFVGVVSFKTTTGAGSYQGGTKVLAAVGNFLLWYARDRANVKYRQLFREKVHGSAGSSQYTWLETTEGDRRQGTDSELRADPPAGRVFSHDQLTSQTTREAQTTVFDVEFGGRTFRPQRGGWKTNREGMARLAAARSLSRSETRFDTCVISMIFERFR